jgi:hypothetical protein
MAFMTFVKNHLVSLLSGVAALLFVGIGVFGMMSNSVVTAMEEKARIAGQIESLRAQAKNEACIQAEAERGRRFQDDYSRTLEAVQRINERKLLMDGIFPTVARDSAVYDFRDAYKAEVGKLPYGQLAAGDLPSDAEKAAAAEDIYEAAQREQEKEGEGGPGAKPIKDVLAAGPRPGPPGPGMPGPPGTTFRGSSPGGVSVAPGVGGLGGRPGMPSVPGAVAGDPKTDHVARANVVKARSIRCYASLDSTHSSFHVSPIWDSTTKPTPDEMWYAQVGLWIQQDIVAAIADLNEEAAQQLPEDQVYVENMPVKRLQAIRVMGYLTESGPIPFAAYSAGPGGMPLEIQASFTGRKSNALFDVVRFRMTVVVDQRALLQLIDRITRQNFYQLLEMDYRAVSADDPDIRDGYLYGAAPIVRANLHFEGYMARNVYEKMFPAEVRAALGIKDSK